MSPQTRKFSGDAEAYGIQADMAADGIEVLQALERQPYDLILMDVKMPEMDGIDYR